MALHFLPLLCWVAAPGSGPRPCDIRLIVAHQTLPLRAGPTTSNLKHYPHSPTSQCTPATSVRRPWAN
ncbi:hypothetical protein E2C01_034519 [Portunus trituberculatus]|uniref:Uncharacterized protein n=1 Tax=Portunus trituberculatus TaxID=210409 RepID=A0A5B7F316_PORTR|nr:hypothetical protein [Portunus trituberculatus]